MPNDVDNHLRISRKDGTTFTADVIHDFWRPFLSLEPLEKDIIKTVEERYFFDFEKLVPPPDNYYRGGFSSQDCPLPALTVGGNGRKVMVEPVYSETTLLKQGFVIWYGWNRENWGTKWNSYRFSFDFSPIAEWQVNFTTAWSIPYPIIRLIQMKAETMGYNLYGQFDGELDEFGKLENGEIKRFKTRFNETEDTVEWTEEVVSVTKI